MFGYRFTRRLTGCVRAKVGGSFAVPHRCGFSTAAVSTALHPHNRSYDVVIAGGGVIGSSIAYFLSSRANQTAGRAPLSIAVVEKDDAYEWCSSARSASSIRHQFSTPENVAISQFGTQFLREVKKHLHVPGGSDSVDVSFREFGYLFLSSEKGMKILESNHAVQRACGADVALLTPPQLRERFPWLDTSDVAGGSLGVSGEGWFDAYTLMRAFRAKATSLGVTYIPGDVTGVDRSGTDTVSGIRYQPRSRNKAKATPPVSAAEHAIKCGAFVNACGPHAALVSRMAGFDIPVRARKRSVFVFECRGSNELPASATPHHASARPLSNSPLLIDPSGVYYRPEGANFIAGVSPNDDPVSDPDMPAGEEAERMTVDHALWDSVIWPAIATRVPAFEAVKVVGSWAGYYDYNTFDQNAIVGRHPLLRNYYLANGFSGHGLQQSPAVGRAVSELIVDGRFTTLDLSRFQFERIANKQPIVELNVV